MVRIVESFRVRNVSLEDGTVEVTVLAASEDLAKRVALRDSKERFDIEDLEVRNVSGSLTEKKVIIGTS